MIKWQIC